jgi:hypothetical protein
MIVLDRIRLTGPVLTICPLFSREDEGHSILLLFFDHGDTEARRKAFFYPDEHGSTLIQPPFNVILRSRATKDPMTLAFSLTSFKLSANTHNKGFLAALRMTQ